LTKIFKPRMTRISRISREALWSAATWRRFREANHE
jgi:hypothetical protein